MSLRICGLLVVVGVLLAGCQTVPYYSVQRQFSPPPAVGQGRVLISSFQIPKRDLLGLLFMRSPNLDDHTSIYDLTNEPTYIGTLTTEGGSGSGIWLEHDTSPGQHTLMLTRRVYAYFPDASQDASHVDFIELDVEPGATQHVVISNYGVLRNPYFGRVKIEDRHREACLRFRGVKPGAFGGAFDTAIEAYMTQNGIPLEATDFKYFCRSLAGAIVLKPNATGLAEFSKVKSVIEATQLKNYDNWKSDNSKAAVELYDLMRLTERNSWAAE